MPSLGDTVGGLARHRKQRAGWPSVEQPKRLTEIVGFGANPGSLRLLYYRPDGLEAGAPLVVVLHGCTQAAEGYAAGAGWLTLADRYGFAVLCPEQRSANNANLCFNWFEPGDTARGAGEAASIRDMVGYLLADGKLDPARVFVTGLSAGGAMTSAMLAAYPEVFAGGGIVVGLPYGAAEGVQQAFGAMYNPADKSAAAWGELVRGASAHPGPWPRVAVWHSDSDATVKSANGDAVARQWAQVHGASAAAADSVDGHKRLRWTDAQGQVVVEHYVIKGLPHGAPLACGGEDGCGTAGAFLIEAGISSSLEIARFWGLVGARRVETKAAQPVTPPTSARGLDVQSVITNALTRAGLMK